jgi:hypothetical protein
MKMDMGEINLLRWVGPSFNLKFFNICFQHGVGVQIILANRSYKDINFKKKYDEENHRQDASPIRRFDAHVPR